MKKVTIAIAALGIVILVALFSKGGNNAALAVGEAALKTAGPDVSKLIDMAETLEESCAKNSHGMSQEECVQTVRTRKEACAQKTAEMYPGKMDSTEKMGATISSFVLCIFPKQGQ
jgi:hypothetical protein